MHDDRTLVEGRPERPSTSSSARPSALGSV
ncbi:hypothetical protein EES46_15300 [Streptomyces sp. ADI98-10]|nr:hypothetical protein EES46_15300 [Streptomyces sp. ADI98-10]